MAGAPGGEMSSHCRISTATVRARRGRGGLRRLLHERAADLDPVGFLRSQHAGFPVHRAGRVGRKGAAIARADLVAVGQLEAQVQQVQPPLAQRAVELAARRFQRVLRRLGAPVVRLRGIEGRDAVRRQPSWRRRRAAGRRTGGGMRSWTGGRVQQERARRVRGLHHNWAAMQRSGKGGMQAQAKRAQDLENGAEVGARSPDSALYRLSRDSPVSRATWVMPLARAISPSALQSAPHRLRRCMRPGRAPFPRAFSGAAMSYFRVVSLRMGLPVERQLKGRCWQLQRR